MITLFIVQSCADAKDVNQTLDSFNGLVDDLWCVRSLDEVNKTEKANEWYGVMYDDERIDERLNEGLKVFIEQSEADVLVLFRIHSDGNHSKAPRLFRRHITLKDVSLLPEQENLIVETVLNGWVLSNNH
uniref:Uncharacterized protein n=1 Tax=viral metagenome TaxID=1070528 RepID=A0A6H1ZK87_9ZZZZ